MNSRWEKLADLECEATLTVCGGMLASVGYKDGVFSRKVLLWREEKWTIMTEMLVGCMWSCVISLSEGCLLVMGEKDCECLAGSNNVQVFDGTTKTWHFGLIIYSYSSSMLGIKLHRYNINPPSACITFKLLYYCSS